METVYRTKDGKEFYKKIDAENYERENLKRPEIQKDIDFSGLIDTAKSYMEEIENGEESDTHWLYEEVMMLVYGEDIFKEYINKITY